MIFVKIILFKVKPNIPSDQNILDFWKLLKRNLKFVINFYSTKLIIVKKFENTFTNKIIIFFFLFIRESMTWYPDVSAFRITMEFCNISAVILYRFRIQLDIFNTMTRVSIIFDCFFIFTRNFLFLKYLVAYSLNSGKIPIEV